jgi:putative ABC transport system permease protein
MTGIDLNAFNTMSGGFRYLSGGSFQGPDDILVDEYYAKQNKLKVGDKKELMGHMWRISGIVESGKLGRVFCELNVLQDLTANSHKVSVIYIKLKRGEEQYAQQLVDDLRAEMPKYGIYTTEEFASLISVDSVGVLKAFIYVVVGIAVVVGFIVVFMAMYTAVLERTREIGILKALGASPATIVNVLIRETILIAIIGSIVGILLSYLTRYIIGTLIPSTLIQEIVPPWWGISGAIAISGALLGALYPGVKAARQDAIEALSYE